ncbi:MAG TPA: hypothetical protein VFF06_00500, partial [Polyangia bacterium]|nr:hypothetical protein [Polyangia bacterium]
MASCAGGVAPSPPVGSERSAIDIAPPVSGPLYQVIVDSVDTIQPATQWPTCQPLADCTGVSYLCTVEYDYHAPLATVGANGLPACPSGKTFNAYWAYRGSGDLWTPPNQGVPASDAVRLSLAATAIDAFGMPSALRNDHFGCPIGESYGRTVPGGHYTACQSNPDTNNGHTNFMLNPIAVAPGEQLNLAFALSVINPSVDTHQLDVTTVSTSNSTGNIVADAGGVLQVIGGIVAILPGGAIGGGVVAAVGAFLSVVGAIYSQATMSNPYTYASNRDYGCPLPPSLIPGFDLSGSPATGPNDTTSPVTRVSLDGRQLYASTLDGDFTFSFNLNFGDYPSTTYCRRPSTVINLRVRRVAMEQTGVGFEQRSGLNAAPQADQLDSFAFDSSGTLVHRAFNDPSTPPLTWSDTSSPGPRWVLLPNYTFDLYPHFVPKANLASVSRSPTYLGLATISQDGLIQWAERGRHGWSGWATISHAPLGFLPGAPLAAAVIDPANVSIFAIATDGSIQRIDGTCSDPSSPCTASSDQLRWHAPIQYAPPGTIVAANLGAGIAAVPLGSVVHVFAFKDDWNSLSARLVHTDGTCLDVGWSFPSVNGAGFFGGSNLAAIARGELGADQIDLFAVDGRGVLENVTFTPGWPLFYGGRCYGTRSTFSAPQALTNAATLAFAGAPVAVVSRKVDTADTGDLYADRTANHDHVDAFTVGQNGFVIHAPWIAGQNGWSWLATASYVPNNGTQPIQAA